MANIFFTFDYELFFGRQTGTVEKCLIQPTEKLMEVAAKYKARFTFFVDVLYLMKLASYSNVPELKNDHDIILAQLKKLVDQGHDIQLHLHPHWVNATYDGEWKLDYSNYRIQNFSEVAVEEMVQSSIIFLENITKQKVFAFRAGGWCIQPFDKLYTPFQENGVWLDSTVYNNGYNKSVTHYYDFRKSPDLDIWNFEKDPILSDHNGIFTELPISSSQISPFFFWRLIIIKKLFHQKYLGGGDGEAISKGKLALLRMVVMPTQSVVSCDGYKSSLMYPVFKNFVSLGKKNFVVIAHPKAMSAFSFKMLDRFLYKVSQKGHQSCSIRNVFGGDPKIESIHKVS